MIFSLYLRRAFLCGILLASFVSFTSMDALTVPFSVSVQPSPVTLESRSSFVHTSATVTPEGGFTGGVNITCALVSQPTGALLVPQCVLGNGLPTAPPTLTIKGTSPVSAQITIFGPGVPMPVLRSAQSGGLWFPALMALFFFFLTSHKRKWRYASAVCVAVFSLALLGCGGMSNANSAKPGSYTYTVTAASQAVGASPSFVATTSLVVIVQ